jgi:hypothetical protein
MFSDNSVIKPSSLSNDVDVKKISYYSYDISNVPNVYNTIILFQSFHPGWKAYVIDNTRCTMNTMGCRIQNWFNETFPFLFGKELENHILVNNWSNGWIIESTNLQINKSTNQCNNETMQQCNNVTIVLFFLPQLLQCLGFALLPIPFLILLLKK